MDSIWRKPKYCNNGQSAAKTWIIYSSKVRRSARQCVAVKRLWNGERLLISLWYDLLSCESMSIHLLYGMYLANTYKYQGRIHWSKGCLPVILRITENSLNCWKFLKTIKPQRNDEICIGVRVTKVERIGCMAYG